jgi:hypothetical protein
MKRQVWKIVVSFLEYEYSKHIQYYDLNIVIASIKITIAATLLLHFFFLK